MMRGIWHGLMAACIWKRCAGWNCRSCAVVGRTQRRRDAWVRVFHPNDCRDYSDVLRIEDRAVHICTPTRSTFPWQNPRRGGKHVSGEKPLATTEKRRRLVALAAQGVRTASAIIWVTIRWCNRKGRMREEETWARSLLVQGRFQTGCYTTRTGTGAWMPSGGPSRCMADIGSHWFDMPSMSPDSGVLSLCRSAHVHSLAAAEPHGRNFFQLSEWPGRLC